MSELYNEEIKEKFLKQYPENTARSYRRVFVKSKTTEEMMKKDLYEFNMDEIEYVAYELAPISFGAALTYGRIITSYITWAIEQGLRSNNINPLKTVRSSYFEKFVDKSLKLYISDKELRRIEDRCVNAQDAVIFRLLFEGAGGKKYAELRNIKREDIDEENNTIRLIDEDEQERTIKFSDRAIDLALKACNQEVYYKKNGEPLEAENLRSYTDLVKSNYMLRASITKTDNYDRVDHPTIYRRINLITELLGLNYLNAKNITKSGMIFMAKQLIEDEGELGSAQYKKIAERFNINNPYSLKNFLTYQTVESVYGGEEKSKSHI